MHRQGCNLREPRTGSAQSVADSLGIRYSPQEKVLALLLHARHGAARTGAEEFSAAPAAPRSQRFPRSAARTGRRTR
jgi:hypothetical protein